MRQFGMFSGILVIFYFFSLAEAQTCNEPLLQNYSPVQAFVDRILVNSLSGVVGAGDLPLLKGDSYFIGESPNNVTTVIELNAPTSGLQGSFWITGIAIVQRPINSVATVHSCDTVESLDTQLFQLQYRKNGVWNEFVYDNAPLSLYSFDGVTDAEEAEIKVAVIPTVVDSIKISKYYPRIARFCFQVELYGCEATESLIHPDILQYDMLLPNAQSGPLNKYTFSDYLYTGSCSNGICTGGAGLLTDGFIESSTYTAYSKFTGWDGSSTYSVQLYLHSIYTINRIIVYGSEWLALPVDSRAPDYITVNEQRFKVSTIPGPNEADFSYFGTGVYFISIPIVTTASVLDFTFEGSSYYSLLLSEIELVADMGGSVQLREHVYYSNGSNVALEPLFVFSPENYTLNQSSLNQTFPTLPLTTNTYTQSNTMVGNSTLFPRVELIIPFSTTIAILFVSTIVLLVLSIVLCGKLVHRNKPKERRVLSETSSLPVIDNVHYSPSIPAHPHSSTNPQFEKAAYESITSFDDCYVQLKPAASNTGQPDSTRYSIVMEDYSHLKSQLSPVSVNPAQNTFPVPTPLKRNAK